MCCTQLAGNAGPKKSPKIRHLGTIAQICRAISLRLKHVSTVGEKLVKKQYLLHMSSQYGELRPIRGWDRFISFGHPSKFQRGSRLGLLLQRRFSTEANQTLCDVWPSPGLVHYIYFLGGSCPVTEFCQVQHALCIQDLRSPILAALLHGTLVVNVSQILQHWTEGATYIR